MPKGPSWLIGDPELPYTRHTSYVGQDVLLSLTFLNSSAVPTQPTSITYEIDSLSSAQPIVAPTSVIPSGSTQILQIAGSVMQTTRQYYGRENFQVWITAVIPDTNATSGSITVMQIVIIELIAIATPPK